MVAGASLASAQKGETVKIALADAIGTHNERNLGKEVIYLDDAAVDSALTNEKCSFAHFRLDADTSMKMQVLTSFMKDQTMVKKVYLRNQNYSHGQQVAKYFKEGLARIRHDAQIVGKDLQPSGQVKNFAPHVAKIKASGADTLVTPASAARPLRWQWPAILRSTRFPAATSTTLARWVP